MAVLLGITDEAVEALVKPADVTDCCPFAFSESDTDSEDVNGREDGWHSSISMANALLSPEERHCRRERSCR